MNLNIGIDASNIRSGGGLTHLIEILSHAKSSKHSFSKVFIWSNNRTLNKIPDAEWLIKLNHPLLNKSFAHRLYWQIFKLKEQTKSNNCDIVFVPGGTDSSTFKPIVSMSQNMLPFEKKELFRFGFSFLTIKLLILRITQSRTFSNSDGIIFLTNYAKNEISKKVTINKAKQVIPHGIDKRFFSQPNEQRILLQNRLGFKIIYVSIIDMYKHQWNVARAVSIIRTSGIPVTLELIGPAYPPALKKLNKHLNTIDPKREFIIYHGSIPYTQLHEIYSTANINVFASSCENLPNILLEAMAGGVPIACSNFGPMPEVLGEAGVYFNPEKPQEIADALLKLINNPDLRLQKAQLAYQQAQQYTWERCADETFQFIAEVAKDWQASHVNN